MSDKMTLIFLKETGHVLGLVTRAADPDSAVTAEELSGGALLVRYVGDTKRAFTPQARFDVPADELDAQVVDFDTLVLVNPRAFFVDADKNVQPLNLTKSVVKAEPPTGVTTQIYVEVSSADLNADTSVWLQVTDGGQARTQAGKITKGQMSTILNVGQLSKGTYYVLALVAGCPPNSFTFTIT